MEEMPDVPWISSRKSERPVRSSESIISCAGRPVSGAARKSYPVLGGQLEEQWEHHILCSLNARMPTEDD